jgi:hypothetical protein
MLTPRVENCLARLARIIGDTPMLAIKFEFRGRKRTIYAKYEPLNMTGSIKDRMALHILKRAYEDGRIRPGDTIARRPAATRASPSPRPAAPRPPGEDLHAGLGEPRA